MVRGTEHRFRYQLTQIGRYARLYVAQKISNRRFKIAGGRPGREVSWQVSGLRNDQWARANPMHVEQEKPAQSEVEVRRPAR